MFGPFWRTLAEHGDRCAILEPSSGRSWTYRQLASEVSAGAEALADERKRLVMICSSNRADVVLAYLSSLVSGHAVLICEPRLEHRVGGLIADYEPDVVLGARSTSGSLPDGYLPAEDLHHLPRLIRRDRSENTPFEELALVLPTSGTSGNPRSVRLSRSNVAANAEQIVMALGIEADHRALTVLPISYVYGLSVLNSHLRAGASLVIQSKSALSPEFWDVVASAQVTSLSGVPFTYEIFRQLGLDRMDLPSLRILTTSGGRISKRTLSWLRSELSGRLDIYLMYGMTEGAGRLSVLPPHMLTHRTDAVGFPVPHGQITSCGTGELVFRGPNVMLGYAHGRADLSLGDACGGVLHTGDLGRIDADGCVHITGRLSRTWKFLGRRFSLEDLEACFAGLGEVAAVACEGAVTLFHAGGDISKLEARSTVVAQQHELPPMVLRLENLPSLPRTPSGKIDYPLLAQAVGAGAMRNGDGVFG